MSSLILQVCSNLQPPQSGGVLNRIGLRLIKRQKKTGRPVFVPLNGIAQSIIRDGEDRNPADKVFRLLANTKSQTNQYLLKWAEKAGVKKTVGWHTARRTFATWELEHGVDIYTVAKLLGHKNIKQVAKYAQATDKLRRSAVAALPRIKLWTDADNAFPDTAL
jgi:integrase